MLVLRQVASSSERVAQKEKRKGKKNHQKNQEVPNRINNRKAWPAVSEKAAERKAHLMATAMTEMGAAAENKYACTRWRAYFFLPSKTSQVRSHLFGKYLGDGRMGDTVGSPATKPEREMQSSHVLILMELHAHR